MNPIILPDMMEKNILRNCGAAALQFWQRQGWVCAPLVSQGDDLRPEPYLRYRLYLPDSNRFYHREYCAYSEEFLRAKSEGLKLVERRILIEFAEKCQQENIALTFEQMSDCLTAIAVSEPPSASSAEPRPVSEPPR